MPIVVEPVGFVPSCDPSRAMLYPVIFPLPVQAYDTTFPEVDTERLSQVVLVTFCINTGVVSVLATGVFEILP